MILQKISDLEYRPQRIVSLVPSQTELLHYLGLEAETVGITKFCVHPQEWFRSKKRVGGTKTLHIEDIRQLQPDLIIAGKEENEQEQVEQLAQDHPIWVTDINNLDDALQMIDDIGGLTEKIAAARILINGIKEKFSSLTPLNSSLRTAYLIWRNPFMTVGGDSFINDMLARCGFQNIFVGQNRYPQLQIAELQIAHCQLLFLSSEPYPFKQKHIDELATQLPDTKIMLVDGEMFSWYGSRLLKAVGYFKQLISSIQV